MKNILKNLILPFICSTVVLSVFAQSKAAAKGSFLDAFKIRKTFESKTDADNSPAIASFTLPNSAANSFLINGGIGLNIGTNNCSAKNNILYSNSWDAFFVYNKNTLITSPQHNYKLGVTSNQTFLKDNDSGTSHFWNNTLEYLREYKDTTHSLVLTSYWHPFNKFGKIPVGNYRHINDNPSRFLYNVAPQFGLEYQGIFDANSSNKKGYDTRAYGNVGFNMQYRTRKNEKKSLVPKNDPKYKLLELNLAFTERYSFLRNESNYDRSIPLFTAGLTLYPLEKEKDNFSLGLSYNNGADPINAIAKQTYWLFTIQFKK